MADQPNLGTTLPPRPQLTQAHLIMLLSLGREGTWAEGDDPLWMVSRHWRHSSKHVIDAMTACAELRSMGLVESTPRGTHPGGTVFSLSDRGKAMLMHIHLHRSRPAPGNGEAQVAPSQDPLSQALAFGAVTELGADVVVQLILDAVMCEAGFSAESPHDRFVMLVKSARKIAGLRSVRDLEALDGELQSGTSVPAGWYDSIRSLLGQQPSDLSTLTAPVKAGPRSDQTRAMRALAHERINLLVPGKTVVNELIERFGISRSYARQMVSRLKHAET